MNKILISITFILLFGFNSQAQTTNLTPIFSYGDETVYSDEFLRGYSKNNRNPEKPTKEEIDEYLELYIKFKLKVAEAYDRQMDTVPAFIKELEGYRNQLAQPYLTDKSVNDKLIQQAYDRSLQEVNASHLLIMCSLDAPPADTLAAFNKIMDLRNRIVKGGQDFEEMASLHSEDPSAKNNNGNLGYFTVFQMIYPFENAAFELNEGDVSMPIRTRFGYHLVKVNDKRKAVGDILVSHIMIKFYNETQIDSAKRRIDGVYQKLQDGADWDKMVEEFSEDFSTQGKDGEINWFNRTASSIPEEFKEAAYSLDKVGDYSKPIQTKYGWHIIKKKEQKSLAGFDETKDYLRRKVERDSRSELNKSVVIERVKKENKFVDLGALDAIMKHFDSSLLQAKWSAPVQGSNIVLFTIDGNKYTSGDFFEYVHDNQSKTKAGIAQTVQKHYENYVDESNLLYEESILEKKYDDFKYIMQEYKDGILLFELTNKLVWSKAVNDTLGLEEFYRANAEKYTYEERAVASIYSCKDAKTAKKVKRYAKKGKSDSEILNAFNTDDALAVKIESGKFEKGKKEILSQVSWKKGIYKVEDENGRVKFVKITEILPPTLKPLKENLGQATSDYQNELEKQWIQELRAKYPVKVYTENVEQLYN